MKMWNGINKKAWNHNEAVHYSNFKLQFLVVATRCNYRGCWKASSTEPFFDTSFNASEKLHLAITNTKVMSLHNVMSQQKVTSASALNKELNRCKS